MPKLPIVSGKKLTKSLERIGFIVVRQTGSHLLLEHTDGRITSVPIHGNKDLPPGTLRGILRDIEISAEDLRGIL